MAQGIRFNCTNCNASIEAWDDGNPYYIRPSGKKEYAYHPDHDRLAMCIGNDSPHLCLKCGEEFMVDSRAPISACPKCGAAEISSTWSLEGKTCPLCKGGEFRRNPNFDAIS